MKLRRVLISAITCLILVGCTDNVEIDNKAFVSTIAIDVGKDIEKQNSLETIKQKEPFRENGLDLINVTYGFPDIRNMEPEKGSAPEVAITSSGYSMTDAYFKATSKMSREFHFGHSKLLMISEDVFKYPEVLSEMLDYISRDSMLNKSMFLVITKGEAMPYVTYKPPTEDNIENYIAGLMINTSKNASIIPTTLHTYFANEGNNESLIPYIGIEGEDLKIYGMVAVKNLEVKGILNNPQVSDIQLIKGDIGAAKEVSFIEGKAIDYHIDDSNSKLKIKYDEEEDKLYLNYNIVMKGGISGAYLESNMLENDKISQVEEALNISMEEEFKQVFDIIQNKYSIDPLEIKANIRRYHPRVWKKVSEHWDEVYKKAEVNFNVKNEIKTIGVSQ